MYVSCTDTTCETSKRKQVFFCVFLYDTITRYSPHVDACVSQLSIISTPAATCLPGIPLTRGTCALTEAEMFMTIATLATSRVTWCIFHIQIFTLQEFQEAERVHVHSS